MKISLAKYNLIILSTILVFLYPVTLLIQPYSYSWVSITIMLISLLAFVSLKLRKTLSKDLVLTYGLVLSYFSAIVASWLIYDGPYKQLDIPNRILFLLPIISFFLTLKPNAKWVFIGISSGGILSGVVAAYMHFILQTRALGDLGYMPIQASGMAMTLGVLSLVCAFYFFQKEQLLLSTYAVLGACSGVGASLLSGGRCAWLLSPLVIAFLFWHYRGLLSKKVILLLTIALTLIFSATYPVVEKRVKAISYELQNGNNNSSSVRLELWKAALHVGTSHPIFGTGYHALMQEKQKLVESGVVKPAATLYSHAHNQYLDAFQERGIIGLSSVLAMCLAPIWYFRRQYKRHRNTDKAYFSVLGICHIVLLMGYFLTQTFLAHHSGILLYTTFTAIFMAMCSDDKVSSESNTS
jgi:O-antigen ligase